MRTLGVKVALSLLLGLGYVIIKETIMMKIQQIIDNEAKARSEAINRLVSEAKILRNELWILRITAGVAFIALIISTFVKGNC
jgi:hypothetical protein